MKNGPPLVSANFVIPYPPGFPIMVPGQVVKSDTITFMRKLDVKEIHGYQAARGLKLLKPDVLAPGSKGANPAAIGESVVEGFFKFLAANPYLLLFLAVGLAVWVGRFSVKGYGFGMVAAAIVVGCALSVWASSYGVKLELEQFRQEPVLLPVHVWRGPARRAFVHQQSGRRWPEVHVLAVISSRAWLVVVIGAKMFALPPGAAGGMVAGSMTMSAAIGSAEQAIPRTSSRCRRDRRRKRCRR